MLYSRCSLRGRPPAALDAGTASGKCRQIGLKHSRGWVLPSRAQGRQARPTAAVAVSGTHSEYRRRSPSSPAVQNGRARFRSSRLKHTPSESARPRWLSCRSNTVGGSLRTAILDDNWMRPTGFGLLGQIAPATPTRSATAAAAVERFSLPEPYHPVFSREFQAGAIENIATQAGARLRIFFHSRGPPA